MQEGGGGGGGGGGGVAKGKRVLVVQTTRDVRDGNQ